MSKFLVEAIAPLKISKKMGIEAIASMVLACRRHHAIFEVKLFYQNQEAIKIPEKTVSFSSL